MTDHERAFLAEIIAAPDDDTPRLIFADFLAESGQEERAEFIRAQCELYSYRDCHCNGHCDPKLCEQCGLRLREREFVVAYGLDRLAGFLVPASATWTDFSRGFVEAITCEADWWLTHAADLREKTPLRRVTLTTDPEIILDGPHFTTRDDRERRELEITCSARVVWGHLPTLVVADRRGVSRVLEGDAFYGTVSLNRDMLEHKVEQALRPERLLEKWFPGIKFTLALHEEDDADEFRFVRG